MNRIELREYEKKSVDEHEYFMLSEDQDLVNKLEQKQILTITDSPITKKRQFKADGKIGVAQFANFTLTINPKFTNIQNLVKLINYTLDVDIDIIPETEVKFRNERSNMLTEVIISSFLNQCRDLIMQGLLHPFRFNAEYLLDRSVVSVLHIFTF